MPLTNAEKQARHRDRVKAKLERLAVLAMALREIEHAESKEIARRIARQALSHSDTRQPVPGVNRNGETDAL